MAYESVRFPSDTLLRFAQGCAWLLDCKRTVATVIMFRPDQRLRPGGTQGVVSLPSKRKELFVMARSSYPATIQLWQSRYEQFQNSKLSIEQFCDSIGC